MSAVDGYRRAAQKTREDFGADEPVLATLGLNGWHVNGRSQWGTYSSGPYYQAEPPPCRVSVDMKRVYENAENPVGMVWRRPNLDLGLPDDNVRDLFEGCIGNEGTTQGHPWDGVVETISGMASVGLNVYLAILEKSGGVIVRHGS